MAGSNPIGEQLGIVSQRLGKDIDSRYEELFGGFSLPKDKVYKGIGLEKGGLVRGYGVAIKGKKKIRVL
jgi:hypothetical protein